jgi:hypothetical protein
MMTMQAVGEYLYEFILNGVGGSLIMHKWSEKAKREMAENHGGRYRMKVKSNVKAGPIDIVGGGSDAGGSTF